LDAQAERPLPLHTRITTVCRGRKQCVLSRHSHTLPLREKPSAIDLQTDAAPPGGQVCAIEIKHSTPPKLGKGFIEVLDVRQRQSSFVINPVSEPFALLHCAKLLPLSHIAKMWQPNQPLALAVPA
jgi:hypothetical protein